MIQILHILQKELHSELECVCVTQETIVLSYVVMLSSMDINIYVSNIIHDHACH